jgi:DNA-directed RNA polymerase specialized sigma subunit
MARLSSAPLRCANLRGEKHQAGSSEGDGERQGSCGFLPRPHSSNRPVRLRLSTEQQAFAVRHLGLAQQQARRFAIRHGLAYEDLLGPAYEGLCKAAMGFAPERGNRPSSYVVPKVKGELLHHLRDTGFAVRISHRYRELWIKARRLVAQGRNDREIAQALEVPLGVWVEVRMACGVAPVPLERVLEGGEVG